MAEIVLVDEGDIEQAIVMLLEIEKTVVEGAGAAPLAALLRHPRALPGRKVWPGAGRRQHRSADARRDHRARHGARRAARARDWSRSATCPASLAKVTACVAGQNANIEEVYHQRAFTTLAVQNAELDLVLKTRNREHVQQIVAALQREGFTARALNNYTGNGRNGRPEGKEENLLECPAMSEEYTK